MSLNICIDIDGTITEPFYWLEKANMYFGTNVTEEEISEYEIHQVLNIDRESYLDFYKEFGEELHLNTKIREHAERVLWALSSYHNLYYVTAREKIMKDVTKKWLHKNKLPESKLYLLGNHYKVEKARELECHIFIEDRYENAIQISEAGFKVLLMDTSYNRLPLNQNIIRVRNWNDVYKQILYHELSHSITFSEDYRRAIAL